MISLQNHSEGEIKEEFDLDPDLTLVVYDYPNCSEADSLAYYTEKGVYKDAEPGDKVNLYFMNSSHSEKREFPYADLREVTDREILESLLSEERGKLPPSAMQEIEERHQEIEDKETSKSDNYESDLLALPELEQGTKKRFEDFVENELVMRKFKDYLGGG